MMRQPDPREEGSRWCPHCKCWRWHTPASDNGEQLCDCCRAVTIRDQRPSGELIGRLLDAVWGRAQGITLEAKCLFTEDFEVDGVGLTMAWGEHSVTVRVRQDSDPEALASEIYDGIRLSMDPEYVADLERQQKGLDHG